MPTSSGKENPNSAEPPGNEGISIKRKRFVESTKSLLMDEKTADFWFTFGSGDNQSRIPVHKAMLAKESEVFGAMFYGELKETNDEVNIVDANEEEFTEFIQFFYADKLIITIKNLPKIMDLANKYCVNELLKVCDEFTVKHLPIEKLIVGFHLADFYDRSELKAKLEEKISENAKKFFATDAFRNCSHDTLISILNIDQLMCDPKDVFDACIDWAKNARENCEDDSTNMEDIRKQLGECLYRIPFYVMSSEQILQIVNDYEDLFDRGEIVELMNMMVSNGRINAKKFVYKEDFAAHLKSNWRWWWRHDRDSDSERWINRQEVASLHYRNRNVMKAIQPFFIWHNGSQEKSVVKILSGVMKIVKKATGGSKESILLRQPISFNTRDNQLCTSMPTIKFVKPIILEPKQTYIIQVDFDDSWSEKTFYTFKTSKLSSDFMPLICYDAMTK